VFPTAKYFGLMDGASSECADVTGQDDWPPERTRALLYLSKDIATEVAENLFESVCNDPTSFTKG
jgi:hypothetical protein